MSRPSLPRPVLAMTLGLAAALPAAGQTFHGDVESANILSVNPVGQDAYEITMDGDPGPGTRQWFHFGVSDAAGQTLTFTVLDFVTDDPWLNGMTPTVSDDLSDQDSWSRVDPNDVSYVGDDLTFSYTFPSNDLHHFAYSFVYPVSRADALVDTLELSPYVTSRVLTTSLLGRDVELLEITEGNAPGKKGIWIQARQHPAECGSSWTVEGFLEWLTGPTIQARALRKAAVLRVVPMMNPDGVALGHYRRNAAGHDLNHIWDDASFQTVPSVAAALQDIADLEMTVGLDVFLDLHTHSQELKNWVYGVDGDAQFDAAEQGFAQTLEDVFPDFSFAQSSFVGVDPAVAKNHVHVLHPDALAYTHEQTYHTITYGPNANAPITVARYEAMGAAIGKALVEFYELPTKPWLEQELDVAVPGSLGKPSIVGVGDLLAGTPFSIDLSAALPDTLAYLVVGFGKLDLPFKGGVLVPDPTPPGFFVPTITGTAGTSSVGAVWPSGVPSGFSLVAQWWIVDHAGPAGFAASNAVTGTAP